MTHFIITRTTSNKLSNPLIAVHHIRLHAIKEFESMYKVVHYHYQLTMIDTIDNQHISTQLRATRYDYATRQWLSYDKEQTQ